ncbi:MAG TPA: NIPSNAP family protein [Myxococcota bacterium]|nr:NIPSNAP family protein [Myxococcota bacterium]
MSVYLHVTLEVHAAGMSKFLKAMEVALSIVEPIGWKLRGAFIQRTGRLNNVIDLWELDDFNHFDRGIRAIGSDPRGESLRAVLAETVQSETIVFADRAPYMR